MNGSLLLAERDVIGKWLKERVLRVVLPPTPTTTLPRFEGIRATRTDRL